MNNPNTDSIIKKAITSGEILKVRYNGGSQPGSLREISPISISDSKVRAKCIASNKVKTFVTNKIEVVNYTIKGDSWGTGKVSKHGYTNLSEVLSDNLTLLLELGWHIESDLVGDTQSITLHKCFKSGKPMKGHHISISYEKFTYEALVDFESRSVELDVIRQVTGKRKRPWTVSAKNETTKSFSNLDKAVILFTEMCRKHAP